MLAQPSPNRDGRGAVQEYQGLLCRTGPHECFPLVARVVCWASDRNEASSQPKTSDRWYDRKARTCQIGHPASHLFLITDDYRHYFCRGHVGQTGAQGYRAWLIAPLQHAQMTVE